MRVLAVNARGPLADLAVQKQIDGADTIKGLSGPAVYIVTQGRGRLNDEAIERGAIIFVGADTPVTLPDGIEAWAAFYDE